jgi:hypothetical protein
MIVITKAAFEHREAADSASLVLSAAWLDGSRFDYVIDRQGIQVQGLEPLHPRRSFYAIHSFTILVHQDVWSLFIRQRFGTLRRTLGGIRRFFRHGGTRPLDNDEIGTAFGLIPHREIADYLRSAGYRVDELNWTDVLREPRAALQPVR